MLIEYLVKNNLLLYKGRLYIRRYIVLCTHLIQEVCTQPFTTYPSNIKTY